MCVFAFRSCAIGWWKYLKDKDIFFWWSTISACTIKWPEEAWTYICPGHAGDPVLKDRPAFEFFSPRLRVSKDSRKKKGTKPFSAELEGIRELKVSSRKHVDLLIHWYQLHYQVQTWWVEQQTIWWKFRCSLSFPGATKTQSQHRRSLSSSPTEKRPFRTRFPRTVSTSIFTLLRT